MGQKTSCSGVPDGCRVIVLDTNDISEIFRPSPKPRVVDWLVSLTGAVVITSVTLAELLAGRATTTGRSAQG